MVENLYSLQNKSDLYTYDCTIGTPNMNSSNFIEGMIAAVHILYKKLTKNRIFWMTRNAYLIPLCLGNGGVMCGTHLHLSLVLPWREYEFSLRIHRVQVLSPTVSPRKRVGRVLAKHTKAWKIKIKQVLI